MMPETEKKHVDSIMQRLIDLGTDEEFISRKQPTKFEQIAMEMVIVGNQQTVRFAGIIDEQAQQVQEMLSIIREQREYISTLTGLLCDERLNSNEPAGNC